jgi:hypothetical protein
MTSNRDATDQAGSDSPGLQRDPADWKSGDDPMTPAQASYLKTLSEQTGDEVPDDLTKAAASEKIDELRSRAGLEGDEGDEGWREGDGEFRHTPLSPNANR